MSYLVVLFAVISVAFAAPHLEKRSIGHVAYSVPSAVSHQSRVDVHSSPAVVASYVAEPVVEARAVVPAATVYAAPAAVSHQSRVDYRSSPAVVAAVPVAEPAVVAARSVYAAPSVYASPSFYAAPSVYAAPAATVYAGGSAVTHQSRVDVETSPAVVAEQHLVAPAVVDARSVWAPSVYSSVW